MKKSIGYMLVLISTSLVLRAQEIPCSVVEASPYYAGNNYKYIGDLQSDEIVYSTNSGKYNTIDSNKFSTFYLWFVKENEKFVIAANDLIPLGMDSFFDTDIVIPYEELILPNGLFANLPNEMWAPSYYCKVLGSEERETLTKFEPHLLEYNTGDTFLYGVPMKWHLDITTHTRSGMYMFYNSMIYAGGGSNFLVKNIIKTEYGYTVTCFGPKEVQVNTGPSFDWSAYPDGEVNLLLYVDGEYIDMYFNDTEHKFGTLVRVKEEFIRQYESLIETNTCDLTNVVWPKRADGSMDYPPPQPTQAAATDPPDVVDIADYGEAAEPDLVEETVGRQTTVEIPWVVLAIAGTVAAALVVVFLVRRKK
jgi:hypothetical protein